jgi:hypothetical protein
VGNAHDVEDMIVAHSIIVGNTVQEIGGSLYAHDVFTGSLFGFRSAGYNRIGVIDFSQILVPVGVLGWQSLSRRHYPQAGDVDGVGAADVLDLVNGVTSSATIVSAGVGAGSPVVLHYAPRGSALDQVPAARYSVPETVAEYEVGTGKTDNFLAIMLGRLQSHYGLAGFASEFTTAFESFLQTVDTDAATAGIQPYKDPSGDPILTLAATQWFGPAATWPKELPNHPYIEFWHRLDAALQAKAIPGMGPEGLDDEAWRELFTSGRLAENPDIRIRVQTTSNLQVQRESLDQLGAARPANAPGDIGAIEVR